MRIRPHYQDTATALPPPLREYGAALSLTDRAAVLELENGRLLEIVCDLLRKNELLRARIAAGTFES